MRIVLLPIALLLNSWVSAQCIPETQEEFFSHFLYEGKLPEKIVSGRSILFYEGLSVKELNTIQQSMANTGIDAVLAIPIQKLLGGHDVRQSLFNAVQKRELSNLVFFERNTSGYQCVITQFSKEVTFVADRQVAWRVASTSLSELLQQLNREALGSYKKQNYLVNETPEVELPLKLIQGSRIEGFTNDFRIDRVAVRLSNNAAKDQRLKEVCSVYPYKMEFVADSITDAVLRQRGFWYVLNCVRASEVEARELLGFSSVKTNPLNSWNSQNNELVYKFYLKKLEFNNWYLGKPWDAAPSWETALNSFIENLRKETAR